MADTDTLSDRQIIARTLDGEAANQGLEGVIGVGNTIQRRTRLNWQGETTAGGVCLHHAQYSCWLPGPDRNRIMSPTYFAPPNCLMVADDIIQNILPDNVNGATHYIDNSIEPPYWAKGHEPCATIGRLIFYNLDPGRT